MHVHHKNGVKSDDSLSNLQVLCALCHKHTDSDHNGMYIDLVLKGILKEILNIGTKTNYFFSLVTPADAIAKPLRKSLLETRLSQVF